MVGVGRGMKNVQILKGWKKGKFLRLPLRERRRGTRGGRGEAYTPPVYPLIFEKPAVTTLKNV